MDSVFHFRRGRTGQPRSLGGDGVNRGKSGETFPWATLVINVTGSFLIGLFAALTGPEGRWLAPVTFRQFFMIGICGGYTTFSTFSLQTLQMADHGEWTKAAANSVLSLVLCLAGVWLGHALAMGLNSVKGQ